MAQDDNNMIRRIDNFMKDSFNSAKNFIVPESIRVDVEDLGDKYIVRADIPGIRKEDIVLTLEDHSLNIAVERKESTEKTNDEKTFLYRERSYGSTSRRIYLENVAGDAQAAAKIENGILTITIPKMEKIETTGNIQID